MREIEDQLGMRRNFYIHAWDITNDDRSDTYLDTFDESRVNSKLSKEDKTRLLNFFRELGRFGNVHKLLGMLRFIYSNTWNFRASARSRNRGIRIS